ncbi:glycoside hydrolase family 9 protein [Parvularcula sp. LCG005]|uniref:glycoside hydrolase family 9 protein n=1 Tax=Parvularcula sp. LCG005 TaxID=3078805 RepID=UPI002943124D|nr:glycoside hydrolase family 9 protein [Parvularcula sp. LCG005]WOI54399.1 glycoside hydrolase family 9 protein [Parvularcula sp. LCG005]
MKRQFSLTAAIIALTGGAHAQLSLDDKEMFTAPGLNVTVFADYYPDGHQTGVTVIQHGRRVAANGDLRLEVSPGQWSPVPKAVSRVVDTETQTITQRMAYPDESKNRTGFNPIEYPDLNLTYDVRVTPGQGNSVIVSIDLDEPLPAEWVGRAGFNFELFPGELFGLSYNMDGQVGQFAVQPNGPLKEAYGGPLAEPMAVGKTLTIAPEEDLRRMTLSANGADLELWDGRLNHNNGWYIVRTPIPAGATRNAVTITITPNVEKDWRYEPVVQVSQLGYSTHQEKRAIIETDPRDTRRERVTLYRVGTNGPEMVRRGKPEEWGDFLRYTYLTYDFSDVTQPGMYQIAYGDRMTHAFEISDDVYARGAWQPTLEYYLPAQMCHMRVNEKYRVWHGHDHRDDARMAPIDLNHFDGYVQGPETLTKYKPGENVPGLNAGGWHDAGDYDLRVESQIGTTWLLAKMVEEFGLDHDATLIDQTKQLVEIHEADGKNDALQQVEHGLLTVMGGYRSLGRLYRGIIVPTLRQYTLLGEASVQTDGLNYDASLKEGERDGWRSGVPDDRWVFTEVNPVRELNTAAGLAAAARVMRGYNDELAAETLAAARDIFDKAYGETDNLGARVFALAELINSTEDAELMARLIGLQDEITANFDQVDWQLALVWDRIEDEAFRTAIIEAVKDHQGTLAERAQETPYGVPYRPNIWGAGWDIQRFGVEHYFMTKAWPEMVDEKFYLDALNFILGVHPGENTMSFASGVGSESALVAYGTNRADWSFIPGGVISGTALIRPDLPELKEWPFFWQQTEYVMGGGATHYMFLALAADALAAKK